MARRYITARGRVSNRGDLPRYVGILPCHKATGGFLVFSSLAEMYVGIYLTWAKRVRQIAFEAAPLEFTATAELPSLVAWPDFEVVLDNDEIEWVEAKYSKEGLRPKEAAKLEWLASHCQREQRRFQVVYRMKLHENGFIDTVALLHRYGHLDFPAEILTRATEQLAQYSATYLETWRAHARAERIPIDVLYHLLYQERLPLLYRPLLPTELIPCRA